MVVDMISRRCPVLSVLGGSRVSAKEEQLAEAVAAGIEDFLRPR